jgi:hypothetical protein
VADKGGVVTLSGDFVLRREKSCFGMRRRSRDQPGGFADLDGLGAALGAKLVKQAAGMGLNGVFAEEEAAGDFAVAQAGGDEAEDLEFAGGDAELDPAGVVESERAGGLWGNFFNHGGRFLSSEGEAEPDANSGEQGGDDGDIDFDGMLDDQEAVLGELQEHDEDAAAEAVDEYVAQSATARSGGGFRGLAHGR